MVVRTTTIDVVVENDELNVILNFYLKSENHKKVECNIIFYVNKTFNLFILTTKEKTIFLICGFFISSEEC